MTELLTPQEVADQLKLKVRTVYEYIQDGVFPNVKRIRDGSYRVPTTDLDRYLNACTVLTESPPVRPSRRRVISRGVKA